MAEPSSHQQAFAVWNEHTSEHTSRARLDAEISTQQLLHQAYPDHHVTRTSPSKCDVLGYAAAGHATATRQMTGGYEATRVYRLPRSRIGGTPGRLEDVVNFGRWDYQWHGSDFVVYEESYIDRFSQNTKRLYILAPNATPLKNGHDHRTDSLLLAAGEWTNELHEQIWVFDNSQWLKNEGLFRGVQETTWNNVLLPAMMKAQLNQDVHGFFDSQALYQRSNIPWKRGIIFHGTPGNGKTLSIKALINSLAARSAPIPSLYVKSLDACNGPKWSIQQIFQKARRTAPCLLILEDLDSLVADATRSYFLNEVDGLESNDGILMIGSTNHIDQIDSAVTKRPSRFDRKYHFNVPTEDMRLAYCQEWRSKYIMTDSIDFLEEFCPIIAAWTDGYSFAYLKELFVTSLLLHTTRDGADSPDEEAESEQAAQTAAEDKKARGIIATTGIPELFRDHALLNVFRRQARALTEEMDHAAHEGTAQKITAAPDAPQFHMARPLDEGDI